MAILVVGCHRNDRVPYPSWLPPQAAASNGAYAIYRQLGVEAESATRGLQPRASSTAKEVREIDERLAPILAKVDQAEAIQMANDYVATPTLKPDPARIGWSVIGEAYERRLVVSVKHQDYEGATKLFLKATRFAFVIAGGDAADALVGLPLADTFRRTLTPSLRDYPPAQLHALSIGLQKILAEQLPLTMVVSHERLAMYAALQAVQDAYRDGHVADLEPLFGRGVHESVDVLSGYQGGSESKRAAFFKNMGDLVEQEAAWLNEAAVTPVSARKPEPNPKVTSRQPWNALARQFVLAGGPMVESYAVTLARTRLLAMTSELLALSKTNGAAPPSLKIFPKTLNTDPYTGRSFFYVTEGIDFRLYSAGADGTDNEGESDDTGTQPDLILEGFG